MIGVLDLQGGVIEHLDHLSRIGVSGIRVEEPYQIRGLAGLIIPGGESTCLGRLMRIFGLDSAIVQEYEQGMKIWGTCAGAILLAKSIVGEKPHLGLIDIEIERNSFGNQLDSFVAEMPVPLVTPHPVPLTWVLIITTATWVRRTSWPNASSAWPSPPSRNGKPARSSFLRPV